MRENPYFNYLPLQGTKGEYLTIHAPELREHRIVKASVFLIPLGGDRYKVGATYAWNDYATAPTEKARDELLKKLRAFLNTPFTLVGLGSRGVLLAPFAAKALICSAEDGTALPPEIDLARFQKHFSIPE